MRFHWVVPTPMQSREFLHKRGGNPKDLWSFVSLQKTAEACLLAITIPPSDAEVTQPSSESALSAQDSKAGRSERHGQAKGTGWQGHETFFIAARTTCQQCPSSELVRQRYPHITDLRFKGENGEERDMKGNEALIDTSKAERLLGWIDEGYPWTA